LFDLGGVLIDFAGFDELCPLIPGNLRRSEIRERWISSPSVQRFERGEISSSQFARGVVRELEISLSPDQFITAFVEWARGPYPGARALLGRIPSDFRLCCLSNSNHLHTPLHRRSMEPLLDGYYFSEELGLVKPDREIFEHVVGDLGVSPGHIVFFDDTPINVAAATDVGMSAYEVEGVGDLEARLHELGLLSRGPAP
jgi:putative hydrolase of the HAD superfamily